MITVNRTEFEYEEGMTMKKMVDKALQVKGFEQLRSASLLYMLNNSVIPAGKIGEKKLSDGDEIKLFPLNSGG